MTIRHYQIHPRDELHDNDDHSDSDNDGDDFSTNLSKITNLHVKKTIDICNLSCKRGFRMLIAR